MECKPGKSLKNARMISTDAIRTLYDEQLAPRLRGLEKERRRVLIIAIPRDACFLAFLAAILAEQWLLILASVVGMVVLSSLYSQRMARYREGFKQRVVAEIVAAINPEFAYEAKGYIDSQHYLASGLFPDKFDRYRGDDYVHGLMDKTPFQFSDIHTETLSVSYDEDGRREERWETLYRGLFFAAEFNKKLSGLTMVVPDREYTNLLLREQEDLGNGLRLARLENPEFEDIYSVYCTSQQEARYVLTPVMMEAMVEIYRRHGRELHFSFTRSSVYCSVPMRKDSFEPRVYRGIRYREVEEMCSLFGLVETIITEMNLNLRIWRHS